MKGEIVTRNIIDVVEEYELKKQARAEQNRKYGDLYQVKQGDGKSLTFVKEQGGTHKQVSKPIYKSLWTVIVTLVRQLEVNGFAKTAEVVNEYFSTAIEDDNELAQFQVDISGTQTYKYLIDTLVNMNGDDGGVIFNQIPTVELKDLEYFYYGLGKKEVETYGDIDKYWATLEREARTVDSRMIAVESSEGREAALMDDILFILSNHLRKEYERMLVDDYEDHLTVGNYNNIRDHYQAQAAADRVLGICFNSREFLDAWQVLTTQLYQEYVDYHSNDTLRAKTVTDINKD